MSDKFTYRYVAPTEAERREIAAIRREYAPDPQPADGLSALRRLHLRATRPAAIAAICLGIAGVLVLRLGMSMTLAWELYAGGICVGCVGILTAAAAYPAHALLRRRGKRRYAAQILRLCDSLQPPHDGTD